MSIGFRLLLIAGGTAAYLGLAVLGGGGFAPFFSHPALIAITVATFAMAGVAWFADGNLSPGVREDRGNRWVLLAFTVIGLLVGFLPAYTDRIGLWTIDGEAIRWLGVVLFVAGGALRLWPVFVLGRPLQRTGRNSVGTHAGDRRRLRRDSASQLYGLARQRAGMEFGLSFGSWPAADCAPGTADNRAYLRRRGVAARAVRRRVRLVLRTHAAADSRPLLVHRAGRGAGNGMTFGGQLAYHRRDFG